MGTFDSALHHLKNAAKQAGINQELLDILSAPQRTIQVNIPFSNLHSLTSSTLNPLS